MKKILIFSGAYFPKYVGGAEIAIKEITDRLPRGDYEFHMITNRFDSSLPKTEQIGHVLVHRIGFAKGNVEVTDTHRPLFYPVKILYVPLAALKAIELNRTYSFHGIWAMMSYMVFPIVLMRFLGVYIPYVISLQEGDPFEYVFKRWYILPFRPLLRLGFRNASSIQTISHFLAGWARSMGFGGEVQVIPNGVDIGRFSKDYTADELTKVKRELGKKDGDVLLVTTSRLVHKNGIDVVIRSLPLLPSNIYFMVYGTGPDEAKLKTLAQNLKVAGRVRFLGHLDHSSMPLYLKACDIFVRPSRSEGMGNSFVEAMAAGLPVIGTQEGGIADLLFDRKRNPGVPTTGWAVVVNSPEEIAGAVKSIMHDPALTRDVASSARRMVEVQYNWEFIARDMKEKVFQKAFASPVLE